MLKCAIMKRIIVLGLLLLLMFECVGQLVRRVDYDAAFALHAGGDIGMLAPFGSKPGVFVQPTGGLKMTFPFTRKWFLGSEINYSRLKYNSTYPVARQRSTPALFSENLENSRGRFDLKQIQVPVYLKYMLGSNRESILFGIYGAYVFDSSVKGDGFPDGNGVVAEEVESWTAGLTVGYELRVVKHLNLMFRLSGGVKDVLKSGNVWGKKLFPVQAGVTLSFDVLRIGDCGCD